MTYNQSDTLFQMCMLLLVSGTTSLSKIVNGLTDELQRKAFCEVGAELVLKLIGDVPHSI
jgi:hypothetical protein